jgi:hypothetical protein
MRDALTDGAMGYGSTYDEYDEPGSPSKKRALAHGGADPFGAGHVIDSRSHRQAVPDQARPSQRQGQQPGRGSGPGPPGASKCL